MEGIVCKMCKYAAINGNAPEKCPVCGAPKSAFETKPDAIKVPANPKNMTEFEKKHVPTLKVIGEGCCTVSAFKIAAVCGDIIHPMQEDHYIQHIDFYKNKEFIARIAFTPKELNPSGAICLKEGGGLITAVSLCNLHGTWINEVNI